MVVGDYSPRSIQGYVRELRLIAEHYPDLSLAENLQEQLAPNHLILKYNLISTMNNLSLTTKNQNVKAHFAHRTTRTSPVISAHEPKKQATLSPKLVRP